jgi:hypothetical protein
MAPTMNYLDLVLGLPRVTPLGSSHLPTTVLTPFAPWAALLPPHWLRITENF